MNTKYNTKREVAKVVEPVPNNEPGCSSKEMKLVKQLKKKDRYSLITDKDDALVITVKKEYYRQECGKLKFGKYFELRANPLVDLINRVEKALKESIIPNSLECLTWAF